MKERGSEDLKREMIGLSRWEEFAGNRQRREEEKGKERKRKRLKINILIL